MVVLLHSGLVSTLVAKTKGSMQFEDSLGVCRFNTLGDIPRLCQALNAATGWDYSVEEAMEMGRRAVNILRTFNILHGLSPDLDEPSPRYGSSPDAGPTESISIKDSWKQMLSNYYQLMGWDEAGVPKKKTLEHLGLKQLVSDLQL